MLPHTLLFFPGVLPGLGFVGSGLLVWLLLAALDPRGWEHSRAALLGARRDG